MIFYLSITAVLALAYVLLICYLLARWDSHPEYNTSDLDPTIGLSILIPARNEAANIVTCLNSLLSSADNLKNPIEVIVIDDHSDDGTADAVTSLNDERVMILHLADHLAPGKYNAYKKLALGIGLTQASNDYVLQIDADVSFPENYLNTILSVLSDEQPDLLAGPVLLTGSSAFQKFQTLDLMGMMAVTAAGIQSDKWHMANGANLCYRKDLVSYQESSTASGDDVSTIQQLASEGRKIIFLKSLDTTVKTAAVDTLSDFYRQRIRWATKNKIQSSLSMKGMMAIPFLNCLLLILHLLLYFLCGPIALVLFSFHLLVKVGIDYIYLRDLADDFGVKAAMSAFGVSSILHPIYIAVVGLASLVVRKYEWKGRKVS